jgi:hypothetical protein
MDAGPAVDGRSLLLDNSYTGLWDATQIFGCVCDVGYTGYDCSLRYSEQLCWSKATPSGTPFFPPRESQPASRGDGPALVLLVAHGCGPTLDLPSPCRSSPSLVDHASGSASAATILLPRANLMRCRPSPVPAPCARVACPWGFEATLPSPCPSPLPPAATSKLHCRWSLSQAAGHAVCCAATHVPVKMHFAAL